MTRGVLLVPLLAGGMLLAACTDGATSATTTRPPTSSTTGAPATRSTAALPGSTSVTTTTLSGVSRCPTADLAGSIAGSSGAAGTIEVTVALASTAGGTCVLGGYPGIELLGSGGTPLPTTVIRKGAYSFTAMPPATVHLSAGRSAEFNIGYSDVPVGSETSCPAATAFEVTPPGALDHLTVSASLAPCGRGTLVVSPVFAASQSTSESTAPSA